MHLPSNVFPIWLDQSVPLWPFVTLVVLLAILAWASLSICACLEPSEDGVTSLVQKQLSANQVVPEEARRAKQEAVAQLTTEPGILNALFMPKKTTGGGAGIGIPESEQDLYKHPTVTFYGPDEKPPRFPFAADSLFNQTGSGMSTDSQSIVLPVMDVGTRKWAEGHKSMETVSFTISLDPEFKHEKVNIANGTSGNGNPNCKSDSRRNLTSGPARPSSANAAGKSQLNKNKVPNATVAGKGEHKKKGHRSQQSHGKGHNNPGEAK